MNNQPTEPSMIRPDGLMAVHSIFETIQGEGPFAGVPAIFVRLAGCNLQCPQCDTEYTADRQEMTPFAITERVKELSESKVTGLVSRRLVVITGGEPFRQHNLGSLASALIAADYTVQIETNGTLYVPGPWHACTIVCSPKTGSVNKALQPWVTAYKYVLEAGHVCEFDGLPLYTMGKYSGPKVFRPVQPFDGDIYVQALDVHEPDRNSKNLVAAVQSCREFGYTLCIQIHKLIGVE